MDEEETKRASDAVFQQTAGFEEPNQAVTNDQARLQMNEPVSGEELEVPREQQFGQNDVPGASEAFAQLDSVPSVQPREFDEASAADLPEPAQAALRDSWDRNLETVRGEIDKIASGNGGIAQSDELGQYMEKLYQKIDESKARPAQRQQQLNPRDFQVLKQPTFEVLVDDRDWQAAANRRLDSQYGEDPFAF